MYIDDQNCADKLATSSQLDPVESSLRIRPSESDEYRPIATFG